MFPLANVDDVLAGFYVNEDGKVNPIDVTMALAKGARMRDVKVIEQVAVTGSQKGGTVTGVTTNHGDITADYVVNCAGMWARQFGELAGVNIPNQAAEHYYMITENLKDMPQNMPVLEDPSHHGYYRQEGGGLMIGMFEPVCAPWMVDGIPQDFSFGEIEPDWDRMGPYLERAMRRVPITMELGIKKFFCGPESFTPDLSPIIGEAPELRNYFVAAGLGFYWYPNGWWFRPGDGSLIINGLPDVDVTGMNIDRLHTYQNNPEYRAKRTVESLGMVYQCHYPTRSCKRRVAQNNLPFTTAWRKQGLTLRMSVAGRVPIGMTQMANPIRILAH